MKVLSDALLVAAAMILARSIIGNLAYFTFLGVSVSSVRRLIRGTGSIPLEVFRDSPNLPAISVLVPARNEAVTIVDSARALLDLDYPQHEVIVVNDGSTDATLAALVDAFHLAAVDRPAVLRSIQAPPVRQMFRSQADPRLWVIDKENSGKSPSLNTALNYAQYPLICTVDADSILEPDALLRIARMYLEDPDRTMVIGGMVRVANGCKVRQGQVVATGIPRNFVARLQAAEYTKIFTGGRPGWSTMNGLVIISGAFSVLRRDLMLKVGGYSVGRPGEDTEVVLKMFNYCRAHHLPCRIRFCADAVCWTQAPETVGQLAIQRQRWSQGNISNLHRYSFMAGRPKYGMIGLFTLPFMFFVEALAPYMIGLGLIDIYFRGPLAQTILTVFLARWILEFAISISAIILDDWAFRRYRTSEVVRLLLTAVHLELWYHLMTSVFQVRGQWRYLRQSHVWAPALPRSSWEG